VLAVVLSGVVALAALAGCTQSAPPTATLTPVQTYTVSMLIESGPNDARWFRDVQVPQGFDAYQVTALVTEGDLEATWYASFRSHFVESILGVKREGDNFWLIFLWDEFEEQWTPLPVGADWFSVKDGHTLAWAYTDTSQEPSAVPSQTP
jgi:hypothetical protein